MQLPCGHFKRKHMSVSKSYIPNVKLTFGGIIWKVLWSSVLAEFLNSGSHFVSFVMSRTVNRGWQPRKSLFLFLIHDTGLVTAKPRENKLHTHADLSVLLNFHNQSLHFYCTVILLYVKPNCPWSQKALELALLLSEHLGLSHKWMLTKNYLFLRAIQGQSANCFQII